MKMITRLSQKVSFQFLTKILLGNCVFLSLILISCRTVQPESYSKHENCLTSLITIDFNIAPNKVENIIGMHYEDYIHYYLPATLIQINGTDSAVFKPVFPVLYENFEIKNINGEDKNYLKAEYDYSLVFDAENYERDYLLLPNTSIQDTFDLSSQIRLRESESDTLLIRMFGKLEKKRIYTRWDTLIVN